MIALVNRQLRKAARAVDGNNVDDDNLTDVDDTLNEEADADAADHGGRDRGMVVAEEKEKEGAADADHDKGGGDVDVKQEGGGGGDGSSKSLQSPPLPAEPFKATNSSSSSSSSSSSVVASVVSRSGGSGGGGGGSTYKRLVHEDGTLISENVVHKDQQGVVMVFQELTPRQVEALSFLVTSFPRTRYIQ